MQNVELAKKDYKLFDIEQKLPKMQARLMNPVVLAYIGDGVHTLYVGEKLAFSSDVKSNVLQKKESKLVCATAQARAISGLLSELNEEEVAIYKRARNAKKGSKAKNSTAGDYVKSTGFEAVVGYLYITGQIERLNYILSLTESAGLTAELADSTKSVDKNENATLSEIKDENIEALSEIKDETYEN